LYVDLVMPAGSTVRIPADHTERAVYVAAGDAILDDTRLGLAQLAVLTTGGAVSLRAQTTARIMLLGGERFPTGRYIWWNFVASSRERIEQAKRDWREQRFASVPGETEFIPLPQS
jgi:hypothetical protein